MNPYPFTKKVYTEKEKELARKIGFFLHEKYDGDTAKSCSELRSYRITDVKYQEDVFHILLGRPGILIGKKGENIDKLIKYLGCKINIIEDRLELESQLFVFGVDEMMFDLSIDDI